MNFPDLTDPANRRHLFEFYAELQSYVRWTDEDENRVRQAQPLIEPEYANLIDDFYEEIERHPKALAVVRGGRYQIDRLKQTLLNWIHELFTGPYDEAYVASRWQVGRRHVLIDLDQTFATVALVRLGQGMVAALQKNWQGDATTCQASIRSLEKLLDLENAIISAAYQMHFAEDLKQQANRQIKQTERLASIGQMITGLAHESRNVLQRSHACLAALMLDIEHIPDATKQATRVQAALDRLQLLYEEVRNYAAPIKLDYSNVDMQKIVSTAWQNLEPQWSPKKVHYQLTLQSEEPFIVSADHFRMEQIFVNLFHNAIDAVDEQGNIECVIGFIENSTQVQVSIIDDGHGIDSKATKQMFKPFFTTKTKGTGLGLSITKRILEAHHGDITVSCDAGEGCAFKINIPVRQQAAWSTD